MKELFDLQYDTNQALCSLTKLEAVKVLLGNNLLAAEIHICGMVVGVSDIATLHPIIDNEILQIQKYLNNEPNTYE